MQLTLYGIIDIVFIHYTVITVNIVAIIIIIIIH